MSERKKLRVLVVIDADRMKYLDQVLHGRDWARLVLLGSDGYPTPPGKRLVSEAAWQVLKIGATIPTNQIRTSLSIMGTHVLAEEHRTPSERWQLAELERRELEEEDFSE